MTYMRQYEDHDGEFGQWTDHPQPCNKMVDRDGFFSSCGAKVQVRTWESDDGAYQDYQYQCAQGHRWWIDGDDG